MFKLYFLYIYQAYGPHINVLYNTIWVSRVLGYLQVNTYKTSAEIHNLLDLVCVYVVMWLLYQIILAGFGLIGVN